MEALRRTAAGEYTLADSVELDTLLNAERPEDYLRDVDTLVPAISGGDADGKADPALPEREFVLHCPAGGQLPAYDSQGTFLMLAKVQGGIMETVKSFFDV